MHKNLMAMSGRLTIYQSRINGEMTYLQLHLKRACQDLNLTAVVPFTISLGNDVIYAQALIRELGYPKGMLVVNKVEDLKQKEKDILDLGYGYSVLDEPRNEAEYIEQDFIEMFSDWGWNGSSKNKPDWLIEY